MGDSLQSIGRILLVPIEQIKTGEDQPRSIFEDAALQELSLSIKAIGILQPITIKRSGAGFVLIAGERRLRAAKMAGLDKIPSVIISSDGRESATLAMVENLQREDLHFFEEAEGYLRLMQKYGYTQEKLAELFGRSQPAIANRLRLLSLPQGIRRRIIDAGLSERHARALLRLEDEAGQAAVLDKVIARGLTVRREEELIAEQIKNREKKPVIIFAPRDRRLYTNPIKAVIKKLRELNADIDYMEFNTPEACEIRIILKAGK